MTRVEPIPSEAVWKRSRAQFRSEPVNDCSGGILPGNESERDQNGGGQREGANGSFCIFGSPNITFEHIAIAYK